MNVVIFKQVILPSIESAAFEPAEDCVDQLCTLSQQCLDAANMAANLLEGLNDLSPEEAASCQLILDRPCCSHPQVSQVRRLAGVEMR